MVDIPIRLHERGGRVISLDCIDFFITVKRQVPVISMPVNAQRYGLDPNRVTTSVRMNCLLRDDDCAAAELVEQAASAFLDFSRSRSGGTDYMVGNAAQDISTLASLDNATITIKSAVGTNYTATFDISASGNSTSGDTVTVGLNGSADPPEGHEIASKLKTALEANSNFASAFTVTLAEGAKADILDAGKKNTKIKFTQKSAGASGNNDTPLMEYTNDTLKKPDKQSFLGGSINNCRSAGDKAQDLLASVINSNFLGLSGGATQFSKGMEELQVWKDQWTEEDSSDSGWVHDDYVLGLQIPYNSLRHAALGATNQPIQGYEPRNFMMITGMIPSSEQDSGGNKNAASVAFDAKDKYTGIHGCLTDCDIRYNAGETVYEAVLTFQPVDVLMGI